MRQWCNCLFITDPRSKKTHVWNFKSLKTKGFQLNQSEGYRYILYVICRYLWIFVFQWRNLEQPTYRNIMQYLQIYLKKTQKASDTNQKNKKKHIFSLSFSPANRNFPLDSAARLVTAEVNRRSLKPLGSSPRITWHPRKPVDPTWDPSMIFQGFSSKIHHRGKMMLSCDIN